MRSRIIISALALMLAAQSAMAQKRIIYIYTTNPGVNEAPFDDQIKYDQNVVAALGATGITAEGTPVAGLGYQITLVDLNTGTDQDDYTATDGDLVFISQTVGSADPSYHTDDPIAVLNTEAVLHDNDNPPRSEMYFGDTGGSTSANDFVITDNTHPITEIFSTGPLTIGLGDMLVGHAGGTLATNVTFLADNPNNAAQKTLGVAEAGTSGLVPPGAGMPAGVEPLPARRVCLGYHAASFTTPTLNGVYLLQRTVQWAIGDQVTAGAIPPSAPANLTATAGDGAVQLQWDAVPETIGGYRIHQSTTSGGPYTEIATVASGIRNYTATGLTNGTTYYYVVNAFRATLEGPNSNEASATPQAGISLPSRYWRFYD